MNADVYPHYKKHVSAVKVFQLKMCKEPRIYKPYHIYQNDPSVRNDEMDLIMITENVLLEGYTYRLKNSIIQKFETMMRLMYYAVFRAIHARS